MQLFLEEDACMRMCARVYVRTEWTDLSGGLYSTAKKKFCNQDTVYASYSANTHSSREKEEDTEAKKTQEEIQTVKEPQIPAHGPL